jgi:hypothetical protein
VSASRVCLLGHTGSAPRGRGGVPPGTVRSPFPANAQNCDFQSKPDDSFAYSARPVCMACKSLVCALHFPQPAELPGAMPAPKTKRPPRGESLGGRFCSVGVRLNHVAAVGTVGMGTRQAPDDTALVCLFAPPRKSLGRRVTGGDHKCCGITAPSRATGAPISKPA